MKMKSTLCGDCLLFALMVLFGVFEFSAAQREQSRALKNTVDILEAVKRIEDKLAKEDRLREFTDIVRIDSALDQLNRKVDRLVSQLERIQSVSPATGRSDELATGRSDDSSTAIMSFDFTSNFESIDLRLSSLETAVDKVDESIQKTDLNFQKIEEIDRRSTQLKDDMNQKLRKMTNIMTSVYEMNKDIKINFGSRSAAAESEKKQDSGSTYAAFLIENLEELERKIKEQFSVLTSEIRTEITGLKIVASSISSECNNVSPEEDEDNWMLTPSNGNARSTLGGSRRNDSQTARKVEDTLDTLVESLGRTSREIRQDIHQGMQDIDHKLTNLTAIARSRSQCGADDPLQTSESIVSRRRHVGASYAAAPAAPAVQSVEEKSPPMNDSCTRVARNVANPKSCAELRRGGANCDGVYVIFPKGVRAVRVYCDMTTDGGGWTMLMRRGDFGDKMISFHKNWLSYKNGFGDSEGEFWLGNDAMHLMTSEEDNVLRVRLASFDDDKATLDYGSFSVANESAKYKLHIGFPVGLPSPAANSLRYHNNHPFSTFDHKNDGFEQNCAATYKGGWWFNGCYFGFLTGEYFRQGERRENWQGILWYDWKGNASLKGAEMMIRPKNFSVSRRGSN